MDLKPGDVVRLKSGGALMTVEALVPPGARAQCVWQADVDGRWETRRDVFDAAVLLVAGAHREADDDPDYKVYEEGDD